MWRKKLKEIKNCIPSRNDGTVAMTLTRSCKKIEETEASGIPVSYVYLSDMKWDIIVQPFRKKCVKMIKASFCVFPPSLLAFALLYKD